MRLGNEYLQPGNGQQAPPASAGGEELCGAWLVFIRYCRQLGHGEIERLRIQDGLPVLAEMTKKKVKFSP